MTFTAAEDKRKSGLPDGALPPTIDQLPEEERWQLEETEQDPVIHDLSNIDYTEEKTQVFDEQDNALDWFQKKTTEGFKYWAQFTEYVIKMDDGRKERYRRVPITKYESDELLDLSAEVQGMRTIDTDQVLTVLQVRQKQKLLDQLKAKYYLRNVKTGKPMTVQELHHVADSTIIDSILEACFAITIAKWAEGKK